MKVISFSCSGVNSPLLPFSRNPDMLRMVFSGERNSWLMFDRKRDFRSEMRLQFLGIVVELGVERDDPAIGLLELAGVQLGDLGLAIAQLLQGAEQFLVLNLQLFQRPLGPCCASSARDPSQILLGQWGHPLGQALAHRDGDPVLRRSDLELVHQPFRAEDSDPRPVDESYGPSRIAWRSLIPGPRSWTRIRRPGGGSG